MTRQTKPKANNEFGPQRVFNFKQLNDIELLAKLGASDVQFALYFNVAVSTVEYWVKNYPHFLEARKRGGMEADMKVAASLYQRAIGFDYEETELIRTKSGDFITKITQKKVIPDVKAIIHWLRCRQRETWSVVPEMNINHSGKINHAHQHQLLKDIPIGELDVDTQKFILDISQKQLESEIIETEEVE